jgi:hypothetical protein
MHCRFIMHPTMFDYCFWSFHRMVKTFRYMSAGILLKISSMNFFTAANDSNSTFCICCFKSLNSQNSNALYPGYLAGAAQLGTESSRETPNYRLVDKYMRQPPALSSGVRIFTEAYLQSVDPSES